VDPWKDVDVPKAVFIPRSISPFFYRPAFSNSSRDVPFFFFRRLFFVSRRLAPVCFPFSLGLSRILSQNISKQAPFKAWPFCGTLLYVSTFRWAELRRRYFCHAFRLIFCAAVTSLLACPEKASHKLTWRSPFAIFLPSPNNPREEFLLVFLVMTGSLLLACCYPVRLFEILL